MEFKERLRAALDARGLTQVEAAAKVGCSHKSIGLWLIGHQPRLDTYERIVKAFPEIRDGGKAAVA